MKDTRTELNFEYEGKKYTLCFTASSIKKMERMGFSFSEMEKNILTAPEELFCGAFIEKHSSTPKKVRLEIYKEFCGENEDGDALNDVMFQMISEAIDEINSHKGNIKWTLNNK